MYCPNCGAQMPDGSSFCGACGYALSPVGGSQAWTGQTGQQPGYTQQPGQPGYTQQPGYTPQQPNPFQQVGAQVQSKFAMPNLSGFAEQEYLADKRSVVTIVATVVLIVLMFQTWVTVPVVENLVTADIDVTDYTAYGIDIEAVFDLFFNTAYTLPESFSLASILLSLSTFFTTYAASVSSSDATAALQLNSAATNLTQGAWVLRIIFVVWVLCLVGLVVGLILKLVKRSDSILFYSLLATAILSAVCVFGLMALNGVVSSNLTSLLATLGTYYTGTYVSCTVWAVASLVVSGGTAVYLFLK